MTTLESSSSMAAPAAGTGAPGTGAAPTPSSLYVGELSADVTEAMLFELFNQIGPVASIRICRDAITRRSLGYGYVNYQNAADGERALEQLNYAPVRGVPCRIMWSQRDPTIRRSGDGNVFIKNLDASIDNKALHDLFAAFGPILSCKVSVDEQGASKGYGFVHYEAKEAAEQAVARLNGLLLNDKKVFVGPHVSRKERLAHFETLKASFTNVFVKNLDDQADDAELARLFAPFGAITSAVVSTDASGARRGFGFVNFADHAAAERAVAALHGTELRGRALYVGRAQKKAERDEELRRQFEALKLERSSRFAGVNLYVKNLAETVDEERLRAEFAPFGAVTSCKVMLDDDKGTSRGFGFVCFATPEESSRALAEMNGRMLAGKPLYVSFAQRKDERRAQLEAQYSARAQQLRYQQQLAAAAAAAAGVPAPMFYGGALPAGAAAPRYPPHAPQLMARPPNPAMLPPHAPQLMARPPRPMRYQRPLPGAPGIPGAPAAAAAAAAAAEAAFRPPRQYLPGAPRPPRRHPHGALMEHAGLLAPAPLTAAILAAAPPDQQKRMLGERLFPLVAAREPDTAAKITGMLLEMDNAEVLHLIDAPDALNAKIQEAMDVLRQHSAAQVADA